MTTLMNPFVCLRQELRPAKSIGNKGTDTLFYWRWDRSHRLPPPVIAFTSYQKHRIKKVRSRIVCRFYRHEIHHPISTFESKPKTVAHEYIWPPRKTSGRIRLCDNRTHSFSVSYGKTAPRETRPFTFLSDRMPLNEYAIKESRGNTITFSPSPFLANAPGAFTSFTLSPPVTEALHQSATAGRFRVFCGHTRELCRKIAPNAL